MSISREKPYNAYRYAWHAYDALMDRLGAFWSQVDKSGDCWLWTGRRLAGYGRFYLLGQGRGAHRLAYQLVNGPITDPYLVVRHTCDNPPCVNPAHLVLGTDADNTRDMIERGRASWQRKI